MPCRVRNSNEACRPIAAPFFGASVLGGERDLRRIVEIPIAFRRAEVEVRLRRSPSPRKSGLSGFFSRWSFRVAIARRVLKPSG